jgi:hypothetical protein
MAFEFFIMLWQLLSCSYVISCYVVLVCITLLFFMYNMLELSPEIMHSLCGNILYFLYKFQHDCRKTCLLSQ